MVPEPLLDNNQIKEDMKKFLETDENKDTTNQYL